MRARLGAKFASETSMIKYIIIALCVIPVSVNAQTFRTSSMLCSDVMKAGQAPKPVVPADGGAYVSGVDVNGNSVAAADVGGGLDLSSFQTTNIPIEIDLAERFGLALLSGVELTPDVAALKIHQDGRVFFNDSDITQQVQAYCTDIQISDEKPANKTVRGNGQSGNDTLILPDINQDIEVNIPDDQKLDGSGL